LDAKRECERTNGVGETGRLAMDPADEDREPLEIPLPGRAPNRQLQRARIRIPG
jgi:hypothetical protein